MVSTGRNEFSLLRAMARTRSPGFSTNEIRLYLGKAVVMIGGDTMMGSIGRSGRLGIELFFRLQNNFGK